ncbi:MAG TPA: DUF1015 family protein [Calditrichia bacterium]|nr:DUF1015 domain-containing protein [Calditrichota bacterium]HQU74700.1 DUF1015 family protein [Calditrichia bacterium]HQV32120.1 DUF1015 family protein [Calditrichia bacterium]
MATVKPFKALRPPKNLAEKVAGPPYDVLDSREAREMAAGNPFSILHVNKPEIDLPESVDLYDEQVYRQGQLNLKRMIDEGTFVQDPSPSFYVYKQIMGSHQQIGLVACASVEQYEKDLIKKHELTRQAKEDDRVKHIDYLNAQVGPVFLTYRASAVIDGIMAGLVNEDPEVDFAGEDGIRHTLWPVSDPQTITALQEAFEAVPCLYVADGHHRSAAATRIKNMRQSANARHNGQEAYNYFLVVLFPDDQMQILDYNRLVQDLNGLSKEDFLKAVEENFVVTHQPRGACKPENPHEFGLYLAGDWYKMVARPDSFDDEDPVKRLDVSILQENLIRPILGIADLRKDKRIDFVGGIRGLGELEKRVDSGEWAVGIALFPTSISDLISVADAGLIMPPKSTWFEPKLKSGLFIHSLGRADN